MTGVQLRQQVWAMLAAVILVLLIACVNVMNMQFGRAALRAKEMAIRGALGATRWRIVRQMLTESFLVATFGAVAGVMLAYWAIDMLIRATNSLPFPPPYWIQYKIDGPVLFFTIAITLVATIVSGLVPALISSKGSAAEIMKEGGRGNSSRLVNMKWTVKIIRRTAIGPGGTSSPSRITILRHSVLRFWKAATSLLTTPMPNNRWRLLTLVLRESITVTKVRLGVGSGFTIPANRSRGGRLSEWFRTH